MLMRRLNGFSVGVVTRGNISVARRLECSTPVPNSELHDHQPILPLKGNLDEKSGTVGLRNFWILHIWRH